MLQIKKDGELPSKTYQADFANNRISGTVDGVGAVAQAIHIALITQRFRFPIYDNQYGSELHTTLSGSNATPELIQAEIPRLVSEALLCDSRNLSIEGLEFAFSEDGLRIMGTVKTVFGSIPFDEVLHGQEV